MSDCVLIYIVIIIFNLDYKTTINALPDYSEALTFECRKTPVCCSLCQSPAAP